MFLFNYLQFDFSLEQILKFSEFNYTVISNALKNHVKNFVFSLK